MKKILCCLLAILSVMTFCACGGGGTGTGGGTGDGGSSSRIDFFEIVSEITGQNVSSSNVPYYFTIGSDNSYCNIDTNPYDLDDYSSSTALGYIREMNDKLNLPEYVYQEMISTSYSQGKQTESFGSISVTWYYHPDKGLDATYKVVQN